MSYSQTYNFGTTTLVSNFVDEAFERCGISGAAIDGRQITAAIRSLNFLLSQMADKGFNLFTVQKTMMNINVGQPSYQLPSYTLRVTECTASNNDRILGGTPFSSAGGNASNAFSGSSGTACTQTVANGYISYTYPIGNTPSIYYVGVQNNVSGNYNLVVEYSFDGNTWLNSITIGQQYYPIGQIIWSVIPSPINAKAIRIRETGGGTLNVQQIYFSVPNYSRILTPISRSEWTSYPNKQDQATPSSYYLDRQISPILTLWPTPDNSYETLVYNQTQQIMDVTSMNQNIAIPQMFMESVVAELAARVAFKFAQDKYPVLQALADKVYIAAEVEDVENVPLRIMPNLYYSGGA